MLGLVKGLQTTGVIGWIATAVFCASYLFKVPATLRRVQALGAGLWILYGVTIGALPVIVANTVVAGAALCSAFSPADAAFARARRAQLAADGEEDPAPFWLY